MVYSLSALPSSDSLLRHPSLNPDPAKSAGLCVQAKAREVYHCSFAHINTEVKKKIQAVGYGLAKTGNTQSISKLHLITVPVQDYFSTDAIMA